MKHSGELNHGEKYHHADTMKVSGQSSPANYQAILDIFERFTIGMEAT
jgi:hypothetical protein